MRQTMVWVVVLAACGEAGPAVRSKAPSVALVASEAAEMVVAWHDPKLAAIGQPVAIGDVVVATIVHDEQLYLVGVDAATSARRWERPASFSLDRVHDPVAIGTDRLAYLRPAETGSIYPATRAARRRTRCRAPRPRSPSGRAWATSR